MFGAALAGAAVGGFASSAGSVWVARRQLTREARVRMFDETVPHLQHPPVGHRVDRRDHVALVRQARMAGWRDRRDAERILELWDLYETTSGQEHAEWKARGSQQSDNALPRTNAVRRELEAAIDAFAEKLGKRLR